MNTITEAELEETFAQVKELRRVSLIDLVPFDTHSTGWHAAGVFNACTPETHARKLRVYLALRELVQRGRIEQTGGYSLRHYQERLTA